MKSFMRTGALALEDDQRGLIEERVRAARRRRPMTQEELAERVGRHPTHVAKTEAGMSWPSVQTLLRLADALEVSAAILLPTPSNPAEGLHGEAVAECLETVRGFGPEELAFLGETSRAFRHYLKRKEFVSAPHEG